MTSSVASLYPHIFMDNINLHRHMQWQRGQLQPKHLQNIWHQQQRNYWFSVSFKHNTDDDEFMPSIDDQQVVTKKAMNICFHLNIWWIVVFVLQRHSKCETRRVFLFAGSSCLLFTWPPRVLLKRSWAGLSACKICLFSSCPEVTSVIELFLYI